MAFIEPLNLENILLTTLAGNAIIFSFLAIIILSSLAARFKMPNTVFAIMLALFGILFSQYIGGLYVIILLIAGILSFGAMANLWK